jgi:hypothetical protein
MRVYTVHIDPLSVAPDGDAVLVPEGFSWWAALFTVLWALYHGYMAVVGYLANDWRRWFLARRGYRMAHVVIGANLAVAEQRYLDRAPALAS